MLFESGAASVYPPSLNERPNGVSCGPKAPTWQVLHGCPVCWAKLGSANAFGASVSKASARSSQHATGRKSKNVAFFISWPDSTASSTYVLQAKRHLCSAVRATVVSPLGIRMARWSRCAVEYVLGWRESVQDACVRVHVRAGIRREG